MGQKIYYLLKAITQAHHINSNEILEYFEEHGITSNKKEILRLVRIINETYECYFGETLIESKRSYGYYIHQGIFHDGELQLLLDSILYNKDISYEDKEGLLKKMKDLSSITQLNRMTIQEVEKDDKDSLLRYLSIITKAIDRKINISFEYADYDIKDNHFVIDTHHKKRVISPYKIILDNNHYYVIGYYNKHKDSLTTFRIDRMVKVLSHRHSHFVDITEQYDLNDYMKQRFNMYANGKEEELVICFDKSLIREVVSRFHEGFKVEQVSSTTYKAIIKDIPINDGLKQWIKMLGQNIEVIAPTYLRYEIEEELKQTLEKYKKNNR